MKDYEITMTFKSGPALTCKFLCFDEADAIDSGKREARRGGFGIPKKIVVKKLA